MLRDFGKRGKVEILVNSIVKCLRSISHIDVWRGLWRCTHAKLAPLTPHPLAWDLHRDGQDHKKSDLDQIRDHESNNDLDLI